MSDMQVALSEIATKMRDRLDSVTSRLPDAPVSRRAVARLASIRENLPDTGNLLTRARMAAFAMAIGTLTASADGPGWTGDVSSEPVYDSVMRVSETCERVVRGAAPTRHHEGVRQEQPQRRGFFARAKEFVPTALGAALGEATIGGSGGAVVGAVGGHMAGNEMREREARRNAAGSGEHTAPQRDMDQVCTTTRTEVPGQHVATRVYVSISEGVYSFDMPPDWKPTMPLGSATNLQYLGTMQENPGIFDENTRSDQRDAPAFPNQRQVSSNSPSAEM